MFQTLDVFLASDSFPTAIKFRKLTMLEDGLCGVKHFGPYGRPNEPTTGSYQPIWRAVARASAKNIQGAYLDKYFFLLKNRICGEERRPLSETIMNGLKIDLLIIIIINMDYFWDRGSTQSKKNVLLRPCLSVMLYILTNQ